ncbi:thrombospondin type 3 repeat-containing protein [Patescibacteria group bacterium]|nr:thrombospondin type 3 repeat-containing protein [Patescibacteria group bacterium]
MFEDGQQNQSQGKAEDIFASTDTGTTPVPASQPQAAQTPQPQSALTSGKIKPALPQAGGVPSAQVSGARETGFPFKKFVIIFGVSFGIIAIAGALFVILNNKASESSMEPVPTLGQPQNEPETDNTPDEDKIPSADEKDEAEEQEQDEGGVLDNFQQTQQDKALNPIADDLASKDTDQDGLSDAKEFNIGTNYRLVDSDNDGLSDWEEVSIFGTDPLDKDSDNDSYLDGEEVQNGYNPLGEGKLLNFEKAE